MTIKDIFVYLIGFLSVISSIGVVSSKKSLNSALALVVTMFLLAGEFALLRADFIATLQVLVYAGAIMILVVFVIMLLGVERDAEAISIGFPVYAVLPFVILFGTTLVVQFYSFMNIKIADKALITEPIVFTPKQVGISLFVDHMISFQAIGMLLLSAVVGASYLAYSKKMPMLKGRGLSAVRDRFGVDNNIVGGE
jgi:NADH-quinone oxidoreductase subunit J